jgi:hypothetical protein
MLKDPLLDQLPILVQPQHDPPLRMIDKRVTGLGTFPFRQYVDRATITIRDFTPRQGTPEDRPIAPKKDQIFVRTQFSSAARRCE